MVDGDSPRIVVTPHFETTKIFSRDHTPDYIARGGIFELVANFVVNNKLNRIGSCVINREKDIMGFLLDGEIMVCYRVAGEVKENFVLGGSERVRGTFQDVKYGLVGKIQDRHIELETEVTVLRPDVFSVELQSRRLDTLPYWFIQPAKSK